MVINSLHRGGAETQFLRVAHALADAGFDVRICVIQPENDFPAESARFPVRLLALRPGLRTVTGAVRAVRELRPDVVISFLYQSTLIARAAAAAGRVPVVISSMRNERLETRLRTLLYRWSSVVDDVTVTNSPMAKETLEREGTVRRGRVTVIPNGLEPAPAEPGARQAVRAALGVDEHAFVFLGVGRLAPQKDWSTLVDAVTQYTGPPATWLVAGDGELRAGLLAHIDASGAGDRIRLLGLRDDVPALLDAADALVMSSRYEGLPNVVLEAMAARRPVVATDVGGCAELVTAETGLLVPPGRPELLAAAMTSLAERDPQARAAMGAAAADVVAARYSLAAARAAWVELVESSLAARAGR